MFQGLNQIENVLIAAVTFDALGTLANCVEKNLWGQYLTDAIAHTQSLQPGHGKNQCVVIAPI